MIEPNQQADKHNGIGGSLRALLDSMPTGVTLSHGHQLLYVNQAYLRWIGDGGGDLNDAAVLDRLTCQWRELVPDLTLGKGPREASCRESTGQRSDGSKFHCLIELDQIHLQNGVTTIAFITDIADYHRMKAEIQRLAAFTQFNPNPVLELTPNCHLSYCNDAARKMAAALGRSTPTEILPATAENIVRTCLANGQPEHHCEIVADQRRILLTFVPIADHQVVHCYIREMEATVLPQTDGEAMAGPESITRLIQNFAHDFNNLLTLIQVNASTLLTEKNLDKEMADSAEQIYQAVNQAATLTSKLLTFGRQE